VAAAVPALADDSRQDRQVRLFERATDQMLVDSPNFLVQSSEPTVGYYAEGQGATFTFRTSLVNGNWGNKSWWKVWNHYDDGRVVIYDDDDDDWDDDDYEDYRRSRKKRKEKSLASQEKKWRRGKQEIAELIADFGEVLTTIPDSEFLTIEARLRKTEFFKDNDLRKLKIKVRMSDVRAYADGTISETELEQRITTTES